MKSFLEKLVSIVPNENQINWQKLEYTAFFHYGMNSFTDREWGTGKEEASFFYPKDLNTDQWCEVLKKAEIKACIITAKHHDGFCLWDTEYTEHSVMNSPLKRDIVAELAASCEKYGIKMGIYLSPWDRHESAYGRGKEYNDFFCGQLTELLTRYGKLYSVWFDGACGEGANGKKQEYDWKRYYDLIRKLQPEAVISVCGPDVRWCGNEAGDCRESEWSVVPAEVFSQSDIMENSQKDDNAVFRKQGLDQQTRDLGSRDIVKKADKLIWYPAEVNVSIRPGWFYHPSEDHLVKPLSHLKHIYLNSVGGNSVLLLNIPPHKDGYIARFDEERLTELGSFIRTAFQKNYGEQALLKASASEPGSDVHNVVKEDEAYWKAIDNCSSCEIDITLNEPAVIQYVILQEQIRQSQRVEGFEIWAEDEKHVSRRIYSGTTIGYKKICEITPARITALKIVFSEYRAAPVIRFIGIY